MSIRFTQAPGSPSSALQTRYLGCLVAPRKKSHLRPVGKSEPLRPRRVESDTSLMTSSGVRVTARARPL